MKRFYFLMAVLLFAANAWAQSATTSAAAARDGQIQREQQRTGLRSVLQAPRQAGDQGEAHKHLSPKERGELRQQLRQQQQHETGKAKP